MSDGALIDDHVSVQQCKRAVDALLSHATKFEEAKAENQLFSGKEQNVWLVVNTKLMHPEKKIKPARIPLKYPIVDPRTSPVCLITKDPQREYKDLIAERGIKFISRVVDIKHLKGKWKPFEARRMLLKENGLFLADERVVPLLPGLLGKKFFEAKKQPIPVCITRKDLKGELERAISSTYFHQNQGTCTSVKIGTLSQKPAQVLANLQTALPEVVKHIKGGWDNVQSFFIKTNSSAALPIWQCDLSAEAGGRWEGLVAGASEDEDAEMDDAEEESASEGEGEMDVDKPAAANAKGKGKKRAAEEAETEKEQPKKKAKAAAEASALAKAAPKAAAELKPAAPASAPASEPAKKKRRKSNADPASVPAPAPAPKAAEPAQEKKAEKAESAGPSPDAGAEKEKKRKRRKSQAGAESAAASTTAPTSTAPAPASSTAQPASAASKPSDAASAPAEGAPAQPAKKEKRKKARASAAAAAIPAAQSSDATAPAATPAKSSESKTEVQQQASADAPATPSVPKKKRRASAVDFFEDKDATPAQAARPAVPPNTPADGLVGETPASGKKKRSKKGAVGETPVTNAIAKLAAQPEPATPAAAGAGEKADAATPGDAETPSGKKQRKRKNKEGAVEGTPVAAVAATPAKEKEPATPASAAEDTPAKKLKRKHKAALEGAAAAATPAPTVSAQEIKQKKSASGVEKKKEKVVGAKPAAKSAKDALVGKKKL
ncbi:ribosomal protein L1 [Trametes cingulata]|nr:ribosomal protein L1 [Trametes cingulata]